ncbi:MAG: hypothetical protein AAF571_08610 [Verrucomicrobiota bacterium]
MKDVAGWCFALLLIFSVADLIAEETPRDEPTTPPTGATISGQGTIELRINVTQYLKGMGLALVPESFVPELKEIRNKRWLESASRLRFNAGYYYLDLKSIGYFASTNAVQITKSDAEGKYSFTGVEPGKYRIYGQYKSRYAAGYWLIPVEIKSIDDQISIDINNENLEEIYNREAQ